MWSFLSKGFSIHRNDIEICIKELSPGISETAHHHLCSFEFLCHIWVDHLFDKEILLL